MVFTETVISLIQAGKPRSLVPALDSASNILEQEGLVEMLYVLCVYMFVLGLFISLSILLFRCES
jgi:hypothetical protein